jgi:hypothetical protein
VYIDTNFESPRSTSSHASEISNGGNFSDDSSSSGYSSSALSASASDPVLVNQPTPPRLRIPSIALNETKEKFFRYLGLKIPGMKLEKKTVVHPKAKNYSKFEAIDFTSPLGQLIIETSEIGINDGVNIYTSEQPVPERKGLRSETANNVCSNESKPEEFIVTYKRDKSKAARRTPHYFSFNKRQRNMRVQILEQGKIELKISP